MMVNIGPKQDWILLWLNVELTFKHVLKCHIWNINTGIKKLLYFLGNKKVMFCFWERISEKHLTLIFQVLVTNPFISAYLHIVLVVLVSNLLLSDIHLALPSIKTAKGIFPLNYFPPKYNFGELASFHNEVFNSRWDCWPALHKARSLVRTQQRQKGEWRSLMYFPSAFEINSWHILNHNTRVTKQDIYFIIFENLSGKI